MILSNRKWRYVAAAVPVVALLAWWLFRPNANVRKVRAMQAAMTPDKMGTLSPEERAAKRQEFRAAVEKLTPQQRRDLFAAGRKRFEDSMLKYAKMSKEDKTRYLDRQIDRMQQARGPNTGGPTAFANGRRAAVPPRPTAAGAWTSPRPSSGPRWTSTAATWPPAGSSAACRRGDVAACGLAGPTLSRKRFMVTACRMCCRRAYRRTSAR